MPYILQILGKFKYHQTIFDIEGRPHRAMLSSKALQEHFGSDYKILFLAPESIVQMLTQDGEEAFQLLSVQDSLKKRIMEKVDEEGFVDGPFDVLLMQSVGEYPSSKKFPYAVVFENTAANVISSTLSQLLPLLNGMKEKTLIVDISTGQNLYVTSLLEAVRGALVYEKLKGIMQGDGNVNVKIAYIPPVLSEGQRVRIEFYPYDVKAFFELPIKRRDVNLNNLIRLSFTDRQRYFNINEKISNFKIHISTGRLAYNAIKYNAPLALFHREMSSRLKRVKEILDFPERFKEIITGLENEHRKVHKGNGEIRVTRDYRIDKDLYINVHFHLALLSSIYSFWESKIDGKEPELTYICETFPKVYEILGLGLNSRFLERDCKEISVTVQNYEGDLTRARLLKEIKDGCMNQKTKLDVELSDEKRNFFAHSGFLSRITRVSMKDDHIYLTYDDDSFKKEVMSWIDNPEK